MRKTTIGIRAGRTTAAASALLLLGVAPAFAEFAIAFNPQTGRSATSNVSWDGNVSRREALSSCGSGCQIVASGKGQCAALVETITTGGSIWAVGYGTTTSVAANQGWHACRQKGGVNCNTAAAICD